MADYLEVVREKRLKSQLAQEDDTTHSETLEATKETGKQTADTVVEALKEGRQEAQPVLINNDDLAKSEDIAKVVTALNELPEPADLSDDFKQLGDKLDLLPKSFPELQVPDKQAVTVLNLEELASYIIKGISKVKIQAPNVTVSPTEVKVDTPVIDVSKLEKLLKDFVKGQNKPVAVIETEEPFDLDSYRAQDIDETDKNTQYIGFLNPYGEWYIIENKVKENQLRYIFGKSGYAQAFSEASTYQYSLLDEAINAL